jgi:hypothetical protein
MTINSVISILDREVELVLEREKESSSIFFVSTGYIPRDRRETSTSISGLLDLEKCESWTFIISLAMKVSIFPAMNTSSV